MMTLGTFGQRNAPCSCQEADRADGLHFGVDVVVIGLNEEDNLANSLRSVRESSVVAHNVVYVDSGSTDSSIGIAAMFPEVTVLTARAAPAHPLTAGQARNLGLAVCTSPLVQFLDADMTLDRDWLSAACSALGQHPGAACVCGRVRERRAQASTMAWVISAEWEFGPAGVVSAPGGGGLFDRRALSAVGGYSETLKAAEETELGARLRSAGHSIWRADAVMAHHDLGDFGVRETARRAMRTGRARAQLIQANRAAWLRASLLRAELHSAALVLMALAAFFGGRRSRIVSVSIAVAATARLTERRYRMTRDLRRSLIWSLTTYGAAPFSTIGLIWELCKAARRP